MKFWDTLKAFIHNWLEKTARSNQEQFGGTKPDCCDLLNSKKED